MIDKEKLKPFIFRARFLATRNSNGCLEMQDLIYGDGYGMIWVTHLNKSIRVNRLICYYEGKLDSLFSEQIVRHTCHNPPCIESEHLIAGTLMDNSQDMLKAGRHFNQKKTHCKHGHEFTPENTYVYRRPFKNPSRNCVTCRDLRNKKARK